jgi:hypothetical protein
VTFASASVAFLTRTGLTFGDAPVVTQDATALAALGSMRPQRPGTKSPYGKSAGGLPAVAGGRGSSLACKDSPARAGMLSAAFEADEHGHIPVKVIDDRGDELLVVKDLKEAEA